MRQQNREDHADVYEAARSAQRVGINVLPICTDGTKRPALNNWRIYQERAVTVGEIKQWFRQRRGLAVMTGPISHHLEALDIDSQETYHIWLERLQQSVELRPVYERIACGYLEATPDGGRHLLYYCEGVERNQKLARKPVEGPQRYQTLIETRGSGGLLIVAPSGGTVHPSGRPYRLLHGGFESIATITPAEREQLLNFARTFDEVPPRPQYDYPSSTAIHNPTQQRPGDLFNQRATWNEILQPHGWRLVRMTDGAGQWRRPGKRGPGISATTNHGQHDLLYVFSTATPFEPERGYTKFSAYVLLEHNGDVLAAVRELIARGYVPEKRLEHAQDEGQASA